MNGWFVKDGPSQRQGDVSIGKVFATQGSRPELAQHSHKNPSSVWCPCGVSTENGKMEGSWDLLDLKSSRSMSSEFSARHCLQN